MRKQFLIHLVLLLIVSPVFAADPVSVDVTSTAALGTATSDDSMFLFDGSEAAESQPRRGLFSGDAEDFWSGVGSWVNLYTVFAEKADITEVSAEVQAFLEGPTVPGIIVTTGLIKDKLYYRTAAGAWAYADGNDTGTYPARCYAVSTTQCVSSYTYTKTAHGFTVGADLFLSDTAGEISNTYSTVKLQRIGWALDANTIIIGLSPNVVTL